MLSIVLPLGSSEMLMANAVMGLAAKTPGKEAVAIEAFARALMQVGTVVRLVYMTADVAMT